MAGSLVDEFIVNCVARQGTLLIGVITLLIGVITSLIGLFREHLHLIKNLEILKVLLSQIKSFSSLPK